MFERNRPLCARGSRPWSLILYLNIYRLVLLASETQREFLMARHIVSTTLHAAIAVLLLANALFDFDPLGPMTTVKAMSRCGTVIPASAFPPDFQWRVYTQPSNIYGPNETNNDGILVQYRWGQMDEYVYTFRTVAFASAIYRASAANRPAGISSIVPVSHFGDEAALLTGHDASSLIYKRALVLVRQGRSFFEVSAVASALKTRTTLAVARIAIRTACPA